MTTPEFLLFVFGYQGNLLMKFFFCFSVNKIVRKIRISGEMRLATQLPTTVDLFCIDCACANHPVQWHLSVYTVQHTPMVGWQRRQEIIQPRVRTRSLRIWWWIWNYYFYKCFDWQIIFLIIFNLDKTDYLVILKINPAIENISSHGKYIQPWNIYAVIEYISSHRILIQS